VTLAKQIDAEPSRWRRQPLAIAALALGLVTVIAAALLLLVSPAEWTSSAAMPWLIAPAVLTVLVATASLLRREGTYALPAAAMCLAGSALVLGWIVIVGLVALGAALAIAVLSQLM